MYFELDTAEEEEEERLYHKGQQSNRIQHDQPISHKLTRVAKSGRV